jgi:hypothetical protein
MARRADAALEVALNQRRQTFDRTQQEFSVRERAMQVQAQAVVAAQTRVRMVLMQMDATQRPVQGVSLAIGVLADLEQLLDWCEMQVYVELERLDTAQNEANEARAWVATAHQAVRALELVLAKRVAERAELLHRQEIRDADEVAARVYARQAAAA